MAKVSIVAPVYGVERYINEFLDSIAKQTFSDLEVILVDDGSKDHCPQILDEFASRDGRYIVIHQTNGGVSRARNTGLSAITGEYVYIVDSDDWLEPDAVEKLYNAAIDNDADIVYGDWYDELTGGRSERIQSFSSEFVTSDIKTIEALQSAVFSNNQSINIKRPEFDYIAHMGGAPWRAMYRASIIKENGLDFDPYVRGLGDDILFSLHYYEYVKRVAYIQHPIYHYREVDVSYSHGYKANYLDSVRLIYDKMEEFLSDKNSALLHDMYCYRVLTYFNQGMNRYFKSSGNPNSEKKRYEEYKKTLNSEPYHMAVKNMPLSIIRDVKQGLSYLMLRMHLYKAYWILKK